MHVEPFRLDSDRYPLTVRILARYADVDPLWHINNVAVAQYYEEARVSTTMMVMGGKRIPSPSGERILIAHQSIDYLRGGSSTPTRTARPSCRRSTGSASRAG